MKKRKKEASAIEKNSRQQVAVFNIKDSTQKSGSLGRDKGRGLRKAIRGVTD